MSLPLLNGNWGDGNGSGGGGALSFFVSWVFRVLVAAASCVREEDDDATFKADRNGCWAQRLREAVAAVVLSIGNTDDDDDGVTNPWPVLHSRTCNRKKNNPHVSNFILVLKYSIRLSLQVYGQRENNACGQRLRLRDSSCQCCFC